MSKQPRLYNRKNGVVLPYSKRLLELHPDVVKLNEDGEDPIEEVDATDPVEPAGDSIIIEKATKDQLIEFAATHYGETLPQRESIDELRQRVHDLIEGDKE